MVLSGFSECVLADSSSNQNIPEIMKRLSALPPEESNRLYWDLPENTRDKIMSIWKEESKNQEKAFEDKKKLRSTISTQGSDQLEYQIGDYYRAAAESAAKSISDPEIRRQLTVRIEKQYFELRKNIIKNDGPGNIVIWKRYRSIMESLSKQYPWKSVDPESLRVIETKLIDPLMIDLRKAIAAETEQDKPWYLREKWKNTYGDSDD